MPRVRLRPEQRAALAHAAALQPSAETAWSRQEEADERELQRNLFGARELELAAAQRLREIREVATARRGFDSEQAIADADRAIDETRMSFVRDAPNATIREMLADVFDQRARVLRHELGAHVEREKFQARIDVSMQRQAMAQQDAVAARTPLAFATNIRTAFDEIDRQAKLTSLAPESVAALKARALSAAHFGRFERLIEEGDPADDYLAEHAGEMSSHDRARAATTLAGRLDGADGPTPLGVESAGFSDVPRDSWGAAKQIEVEPLTLIDAAFQTNGGQGADISNAILPADAYDAPTGDGAARLIKTAAGDPSSATGGERDAGIYDGLAGLNMNDDIIAFATRHRGAILDVAKKLGVPATALAAVIGEEYRTWGLFKDGLGETWTKTMVRTSGRPWGHVYPEEASPVEAMHPSAYLERLYEDVRPKIEKGIVIQRGLNRLYDPMTVDVGPGNINIGTAMWLVKKYLAEHPKDDPLDLRRYEGRYDRLVMDISNPSSDATVKVAGLKLREVQDELAEYDRQPGRKVSATAYFHAQPAAHRDAILDFGYRRSKRSIFKRFQQAGDKPITGWTNRTREEFERGARDLSLPYDYFFDPASPYHAVNAVLAGKSPPAPVDKVRRVRSREPDPGAFLY